MQPRVLRIASPAGPVRHEEIETPIAPEQQPTREILLSQFARIRTLALS
jgi:hypothetical protein